MNIHVRYKTENHHNHEETNLNTNLMYFLKNAVYNHIGYSFSSLLYAMSQNYPIVVITDTNDIPFPGVLTYNEIEPKIKFVINSSNIAVIKIDRWGKEIKEKMERKKVEATIPYEEHLCTPGLNGHCKKRDFRICTGCGAQLPECICPPPPENNPGPQSCDGWS